jgi:acetyl esterase/lipase
MVYFKRLRQPSSSSVVQDKKTTKNYWHDRVHPELITLPIMYTINSWWMAWIFHALSSLPCKTDADIIMTKVNGIGSYYAAKSNENNETQQPTTRAILWIHGGGRILGAANGMSEPCQKIVNMFGGIIPVLSVEYRFPPKHPFPAALHDCHKAYSWLVDKVQFEGRIAVAGMSAGAGLAAELCQLILDEGRLPLPVCQLLLDPMLDDRTCVNETISKLPPHLVWNNQSNMYAWSLYLGPDHKPGDEILPKYASASRRADLSRLPPALITVGDCDLFHDECTEYAQRLKNDGVKTDFVVTKGGFHAFMSMQPDKGPSVEAWNNFYAFGKSFLFD